MYIISLPSRDNPKASTIITTIPEQREHRPGDVRVTYTKPRSAELPQLVFKPRSPDSKCPHHAVYKYRNKHILYTLTRKRSKCPIPLYGDEYVMQWLIWFHTQSLEGNNWPYTFLGQVKEVWNLTQKVANILPLKSHKPRSLTLHCFLQPLGQCWVGALDRHITLDKSLVLVSCTALICKVIADSMILPILSFPKLSIIK